MSPIHLSSLSYFLITLVLLTGPAQSTAVGAEKVRVILDTDANNELDDQHAIAYLLFNGGVFDVEGITVNRTRNGGDVTQHLAEAKRVVQLCGLYPQVPVYRGADGSFETIRPHLPKADFDGAEAVDFIIQRAHASDARRLTLLPVGKLTNIALALAKDPSIASKIRIVWLGSNYPEPGEYNQDNDEPSLNYVLNTNVEFEVAIVRYGKPSGTAAVTVTPEEMRRHVPGRGPQIHPPVTGRHGSSFHCFGDYAINLFEHIDLHGNPPSRALFDMAAVAIVKNPDWAESKSLPAPLLKQGQWQDRPNNPRRILLWENFNRQAIMADFFQTMAQYHLAGDRIVFRQDAEGVHIEGFTGANPILYDNDWWNDVTDGFYLWAKASRGAAKLRGNVVSRDLWDWQNGYLYTLEQGVENARKAVDIARRSGLQHIPDPVAGSDRAFQRPGSGRIEDTLVIRSPGSELIVAEARRASAQNPLVVFVGGPLNTVANAYLLDPTIADRMMVCMTDLRGYNGKDPWANTIVAQRCRLLNYGAHVWWPQRPAPPVMPLERFADLPQNELTREMHRIAKMFWDRSTRSESPDRDDGFGDGAPIFLYFNPGTWTTVQPQRVSGVFTVDDVSPGQRYDLIDARKCDYTTMSREFFHTFSRSDVYH